ncbi:hypothetical protein ACLK1S_06055 [Escherichia coli]
MNALAVPNLLPLRSPTGEGRDPFPDFLVYANTFMAAAGTLGARSLRRHHHAIQWQYILAVEGNPPLGEQGMFCISSGRPFIEKLKRAAPEPARLSPGEPARPGPRAGRAAQSDAGNAYRQSITDKPIIKFLLPAHSRM